jgi:hypothetical protein
MKFNFCFQPAKDLRDRVFKTRHRRDLKQCNPRIYRRDGADAFIPFKQKLKTGDIPSVYTEDDSLDRLIPS